MRMVRLGLVAAALVLLAGCSDGYGDDDADAPEPALPDNARLIDSGEREITVEPGESFGLDTVDYAGDREIIIPSCAAYLFAYAWNATQPEDDVPLRIDSTRQGETTDVSTEPAGSEVAGCAFLEFINEGDEAIVLDLRYEFGELQP